MLGKNPFLQSIYLRILGINLSGDLKNSAITHNTLSVGNNLLKK